MISKTRLFTYLGLRLSGDLGQWTMFVYCHARPVFFLKSPPLTGPTYRQIHQRNKFKLYGYLWRAQTAAQRDNWEQLAQRSGARLTGYNLFVVWCSKHDILAVMTLIRRSGVNPLATP